MNVEEIRAAVEKFGKPKILTVMEQRVALASFADEHQKDDLGKIVRTEDVELATSYGMKIEDYLALPTNIQKSLKELYDEENASLKTREYWEQLLSSESAIGSLISKKRQSEEKKSE